MAVRGQPGCKVLTRGQSSVPQRVYEAHRSASGGVQRHESLFWRAQVGLANQSVPLYLSEVAPPKMRGGLNNLFQVWRSSCGPSSTCAFCKGSCVYDYPLHGCCPGATFIEH